VSKWSPCVCYESVWRGVGIGAFIRKLNGMSGQLRASDALPPVPIEYEAGYAPEPIWKRWRRDNFFFL
jgi:hypothetical protein